MHKIILAAALLLMGCDRDNVGQFEQACLNGKGRLTMLSANEYICTYPDGSVINSQAK